MAQDIIKPVGATKSSKNDAGGGVIRSEPVVGVVKNNIDPIRAGRIQVYIQDMSGMDPDDSKNWVTVRFLSPFYGRSYPTSSNTGYGGYASNPVSYGEWHSPPEIGTQVICIFVNGDMNYGYYIGCIPEPEALTMVPAIGAVNNKVVLNPGESQALSGATQLPVTNLNTNNSALSESSDFLNSPKPVHSYVASVLSQQGLIRDPIRGPITSSAQRETPSRVGWGVSTPGRPIYEGGYTDETIVDAAGTGNGQGTKIVSRRAGHTFVMDDGDLLGKDQLIRLRTSLGHQILMSDDGQCLFIIHANGQSWIELGKEGTIDMFSTNSVNIRTQGDLNLHADNNININAEKNININAKENINISSDKETSIRTGTDYKHHVLNNFTTKVDGGMSMASAGEGAYASAGTMYVNGSVINLNTGSTSLTPQEVKPIPLVAQTDTLFDAEKGYAPAPGKLQTIVTRAPAHQPWVMANKGVDVKVDPSATTQLTEAPVGPVQNANSTAPAIPNAPPSVPTIATVPNISTSIKGLDSTTTTSLVGAVASQAAQVAPHAVTAGTSIINNVPAVGQLAQTPTQMMTGGSVKLGADRLINGLVSAGASVAGAMTNNLFTGQNGVTSVQTYINSTNAQVNNQVTNFARAQSQLLGAGVIKGNENPSAIAGVIMAGSQNGIAQTVDFVKTASSAGVASLSRMGSNSDNVAQNISAGNFATNLSAKISSGLDGIASGLKGAVSSAEGVVTSAFKTVVGAYKPFKPGVPQDLKAIAQGAESDNSDTNTLSSVKNINAASTGLQGLPGGTNAVASIVNNSPTAVNNVPGASVLKSNIDNISTGLINNISPSLAKTSQLNLPAGAKLPNISMSQGSLLSGMSSILPKGLMATLGSAIGSLTNNGPVQIKTPVAAENTVNRAGLEGQVSSILGNPKIPAPTYSSESSPESYYDRELKKLKDKQRIRDELYQRVKEQEALVLKIRDEYQAAIDNYPPGDPLIVEQREKYYAEKAKWAELTNEFSKA